MGKTKTSFIAGTDGQPVKPSYDKAAKEAKRRAKEGMSPVTASNESNDVPSIVESETKVAKSSDKKVRSARYKEAYAKVNRNNIYSVSDAINLVKEISLSKFDGTMELHLVVKKQGGNFNVTLPYSTGKQKKIEIADDSTIEKLKAGKVDFDLLLATADMMPKLVAFARLLGPRGLMPNPKNGTIIKSQKDAEKFGGNAMTIKTEKSAPVIHTICGKVSQSEKELTANIEAIANAIGAKQILKAYLKSTMSPSVKIQM